MQDPPEPNHNMQDTSNSSNPESGAGKAAAVAKPVKPISKSEIEYVNQTYKRILRTAVEVARQIIELGERLAKIKARVEAREGYRAWGPWAVANLEFSLRTAQKFMKAAEDKHLFGVLSPEDFMARVWGHKPKELKNKEDNTEDRNDASGGASGGKGEGEGEEESKEDSREKEESSETKFSTGKFPKKERRNVAFYRDVIRLTDAFLNQPIAESEKQPRSRSFTPSFGAALKSRLSTWASGPRTCSNPVTRSPSEPVPPRNK